MKTKTLLLTVTCVISIGCVIFLTVINQNSKPAWENFVSETHKRIQNLQQMNEPPHRKFAKKSQQFMLKLGLFDDRNVVASSKAETLMPVIAIPFFEADNLADLAEVLTSVFKFLPECSVVVYNMDIDEDDLNAVFDLCNSSSCSVRNFRWDMYPKHVKLKYLEAFRPIIIQVI